MAAQPTTERGRRTRQRIVDAAAFVVTEKGTAGASLDEIGARAAASRSQLYHYFDDKADLLRVVADATVECVLGRQRDQFAELGTWDGLITWMDALVRTQDQSDGRGGCPIANLVSQLDEHDDDIRAVLAAGYDRWEALISAGLAAMVATGELNPDVDVASLAASTLASVQGGLVLAQARRNAQPLRRALDGALTLIGINRSPS